MHCADLACRNVVREFLAFSIERLSVVWRVFTPGDVDFLENYSVLYKRISRSSVGECVSDVTWCSRYWMASRRRNAGAYILYARTTDFRRNYYTRNFRLLASSETLSVKLLRTFRFGFRLLRIWFGTLTAEAGTFCRWTCWYASSTWSWMTLWVAQRGVWKFKPAWRCFHCKLIWTRHSHLDNFHREVLLHDFCMERCSATSAVTATPSIFGMFDILCLPGKVIESVVATCLRGKFVCDDPSDTDFQLRTEVHRLRLELLLMSIDVLVYWCPIDEP